MTKFRPCIDLHQGKVKQIVGGTLDSANEVLRTNFVSEESPAFYAKLYREDGLRGGHVIKLGADNDAAAREALAAYPRGLQIGGGITVDNAGEWLEAGASHVIATSCLFDKQGNFQVEELDRLVAEVGKDRLVLDLSCRRVEDGWVVAMNRWQTLTDLSVTEQTLSELAASCDEFLVHAADVEGKCEGIDEGLVKLLGDWGGCAVTYAGGVRSLADLDTVERLSQGRVDLTIGSALDIFGGDLVDYADCVQFNCAGWVEFLNE
ncbi:MAG: phosphoribosylformimino-5-aminoimidazole carboxamide ribotide isomerase [Verrucomicrobiales bacterium]|nr:phosphoribosylformimino-5-aminoimidazole carboxamide ribotide isomerase [Verrucomicrobiales bacterium]